MPERGLAVEGRRGCTCGRGRDDEQAGERREEEATARQRLAPRPAEGLVPTAP